MSNLRGSDKNSGLSRNTPCSPSQHLTTNGGTGLDKSGTENTKTSDWPGKNLLGHIIGKVAQKIKKREHFLPMESA